MFNEAGPAVFTNDEDIGAVVPKIVYTLVATTCIWITYKLFRVGKREPGLPPGPPTIPLLGNLHQIPTSGPHFQFTEWAQEYGGIYSLKLGPATMIVLTDRKVVRALLDVKSSIYSDRPDNYVIEKLITGGDHLLIMKYGDKWRRTRKLFHREYHETKVNEKILPVVNAEAVQMMRDFLIHPEDLMKHPKRFSNSVLMSLVYGIRTPTVKAQHMQDLYDMIEQWAELGETGATPPVDIVPIFKWLPEGMWKQWRTRSRAVNKAMDNLYGGLIDRCYARREAGVRTTAIIEDVLDSQPTINRGRDELKFACGVMVEAGSDTSASMILACLHAMTKYPDVQRKVQAEIDTAIPPNRSPQWSDYSSLPYVGQVIKETMRWRPTAPLAFPHATTTDDNYKGMFIPKGSIVVLNTWGLHHAPHLSPPPEVFEPARFENHPKPASEYVNSANPEARDHYGYGASRRICPGIHLGERNLFVSISKLLWAFSFDQKLKDDGSGEFEEVNVDFETGYTTGFVHCPKDFPCTVRLRHEGKREIILREFKKAEKEVFSRFEEP